MTTLGLRSDRKPARIGLTPLIDVVFILMIFFMLASTFARERQIDLDARQTTAGATAVEVRVLVVSPDGMSLDGQPVSDAALVEALGTMPDAVTIAVKPAAGASIQRMIDVVDLARTAGALNVVLAR